MTTTGLRSFDHSLQTVQEWLKDLQESLGLEEDRQQAYAIMRAVLHALRDRLTVEEAAEFAAQLPMLLQGVYYHEWNPSGKPLKIRTADEFLARVKAELPYPIDPEQPTRAVFSVFEKHMTGGELEDVKRILPEQVRHLWP